MLRKTIFLLIFVVSVGILSYVWTGVQRRQHIEAKREQMNSLISIGDDIYEAKKRLENAGFVIQYGPKAPTRTENYIMMIVGFGVRPTTIDGVIYSMGFDSKGESIKGIVRASPAGIVTDVE